MRNLSPEDVADRWGCSAQQVRNLFHAGQLRGFRVGAKLIRFPETAVT